LFKNYPKPHIMVWYCLTHSDHKNATVIFAHYWARVALGCRSNQNFHDAPTRSRRLSVVRNWITNWRAARARAAKEAVWRAELSRRDVWEVRQKLGQAGAGSIVHGFASGPIEREFVEIWLSEKVKASERQQAAILGWARLAAWASLAAAFFTLLSVLLTPQAQTALRGFAASLRAWLDK
jgi:hypothetical protein